jgi:hypothetical protein
MFNELEEGRVRSQMGPGDWTHIGPSMHSFTNPKKANSVVFHI